LLVVFASALYFPELGTRDLWNPNEAGYAQAAREMEETGNFLYPTTNLVPRGEKPAPYYWLIVASARLTAGVDEASSRIPSALFAVLLVVFTYVLARTVMPAGDALVAALVLATACRFAWQARWVEPDVVLAFLVALSLGIFFKAIRDDNFQFALLAAAYAAAAAAALIKGPIGLVVPGVTLLAYFASRLDPRGLWRLRPLTGLAVIITIAAPWYWAASAAGGGDYAYDLIYRQNLVRFFDPFDHNRPVYFYFKSLLGDFSPWCLFVPAAVVYALRDRAAPPRRRDVSFFVAWLLGGFAFFSLSLSKRGNYLLPLYPALAVLIGLLFAAWRRGETIPWYLFKLPAWATCAAAVAAAVGLALFARGDTVIFGALERALARTRFPPALARELALPGALIAAVAAVAGVTSLVWLPRRWFAVCAAGITAVALTYVQLWILPVVNPYKSAREESVRLAALVGPGGRFGAYAPDYRPGISDSWDVWDPFLFYSGRKMEPLVTRRELARYLRENPTGVVLMRTAAYDRLPDAVKTMIVWREEIVVGSRAMTMVSSRNLGAAVTAR